MHPHKELPESLRRALEKRGLEPAEFLWTAEGTSLHERKPVWILLSRTELYVLKGLEPSIQTYDVHQVDTLSTDAYTAGGVLWASIGAQDWILCRYGGGQSRDVSILVSLFQKIKEGKALEAADFWEEEAPGRCPKCGLLYPEGSRSVCPKCMNKRAQFLRVLSFALPYKPKIGLILAMMLLSALLSLVQPYLGGRILFDEVLAEGGRYFGRVMETVAILFAVSLLALGANIAYGRINAVLTPRIVYDLKTQVFAAMQRLSLSFFSSKQTGTLMTRVNQDAIHLQYFFHDGIPYFLVNGLTILGIVLTMLWVNLPLGLMVLLPMPFVVWMLKTMLPKLYEIFNRRYRKGSALNALINDTLIGMRVVKAFGKESEEMARFSLANGGAAQVDRDSGVFASSMFPMVHFVMGLGGLIVWGAGGWQVLQGRMTFGTLITFTGYLAMLYGPLQFMTEIVHWWTSSMDAAQRIFAILDSIPEVQEDPEPIAMPRIYGHISLKHVSFSYEPNRPVLQDITLDIPAGETIGLVGHSGAGKSTMTNIITRLYDIQEGIITIDGVLLKKIKTADLRRQIGMVLQDTVLFSGTIAENIAFAQPNASIEAVISAAMAANAHDFIMALPDGYETRIGKKGQDLSGGEKQRISIARALLQDPPILILDEATASLDTQTETLIQQALLRLTQGRTTLIIAHRLSTLRHAHRLVVLERGRILEMGAHGTLIKNRGTYYQMLKRQREALRIKGVAEQ